MLKFRSDRNFHFRSITLSFSSSQHRLCNQLGKARVFRWQRIVVVLSPSIGGVKIILALFWIDIRSVFDVLQKSQPIFFWHVSWRNSVIWVIVPGFLDKIADVGNLLIRFQSMSLRARQRVKG